MVSAADRNIIINISDSSQAKQNGVAGEKGPTAGLTAESTNIVDSPNKDTDIHSSDECFVLVGNPACAANGRAVDPSTSNIPSTNNEVPDADDATKSEAPNLPKGGGDYEAGDNKGIPDTPCPPAGINANETGACNAQKDGIETLTSNVVKDVASNSQKDRIETLTGNDVEDDATEADSVDNQLHPSSTREEVPMKSLQSSREIPEKTAPKASISDACEAAAAKDMSVDPSLRHQSPAYLNAALESLESMRRLNLEVEFSNAAPSFRLCHDKCTHCQREALRQFLAGPPPAAQDGEGGGDRERGINIGKLKLDGSRMRSLHKSLTEEQRHGINIGTLKLDGSRMRNLHQSLTELHQRDVQNLRRAVAEFQGQGPAASGGASDGADGGEQRRGTNVGNAKFDGSRFRELFAKPGHNPGRSKVAQDITSPDALTAAEGKSPSGGISEKPCDGGGNKAAEAITEPTPPNKTGGEEQRRGINIGNVKLDGRRIRGLFVKPGHRPHSESTQGATSPKSKLTGEIPSGGISGKHGAGACDESTGDEATGAAVTPTLPDAAVREEQKRGVTIGNVKLDGSRIRGLFANPGHDCSREKATEATATTSPSPAKPCAVACDGNGGSNEEAGVTTAPSPRSISKKSLSSVSEETSTSSDGGSAGGGWVASSQHSILKKTPSPCLTCGHPTCSKHSSSTLSRNHIHICQSCARLFELDFLVELIASSASNPRDCQKKVDAIVACYDRAKFLLVCTAQYADEIAAALETRAVRSNKLGAGSSATGIVSGITGAVGCATLLFPPAAVAGVPLLITSLVFGGGATAVQTGDAAAKYFSEPNRLAEKMVALHGMALSLLRITEVLSHGLLKNHLGVNYSVEGCSEEGDEEEGDVEAARRRETLAKDISELLEKHGVSTTQAAVGGLQSAFTSGIVATEVASMEVGAASMVGRGGRLFGRVGTTAGAGARFIPIAGGLLSAACVYVEGRELKRTLERIREGNPCAKAEQVRCIRDELDMLPDSSLIAAECHRVFELAKKEKRKREELAEKDAVARQGLDKAGGVTLEDVSQGDIGNLIDVMDAMARAEGIKENVPGDGE